MGERSLVLCRNTGYTECSHVGSSRLLIARNQSGPVGTIEFNPFDARESQQNTVTESTPIPMG